MVFALNLRQQACPPVEVNVRFANLKRFLNVVERKISQPIKVLLRFPREAFEACSREPFWDVFDCEERISMRSFGESRWLKYARMGKASTRNAPGNAAAPRATIASSDAA